MRAVMSPKRFPPSEVKAMSTYHVKPSLVRPSERAMMSPVASGRVRT